MRFVFSLFLFFVTTLSLASEHHHVDVVVSPVPAVQVIQATVLPPIWVDTGVTTLARVVSAKYRTLSVTDATEVVRLAFLHAKQQDIDPYMVVALIAAESSFRRRVTSHAGAKGFMQIMDRVHKAKVKGRNPFDPRVNVEVGVGILADCFKRHKTNRRALGCYNGATTTASINRYYTKIKAKQSVIQTLALFVGSVR